MNLTDGDEFKPGIVTGSPDRIWLVYGDLTEDCTHDECARGEDVMWCEDAIGNSDVDYVRGDLYRAVVEERDRLLALKPGAPEES